MLNRPLGFLLLLALGAIFFWSQRGENQHEVVRTALIMDTLVEIKVLGTDEKAINGAIEDAFTLMKGVEAEFSSYQPQSSITRLNRSDDSVAVSSRARKLFRLGDSVRRQSQGAFSMALGGVKKLWALDKVQPQVPTTEQLARVIPPVNRPALRWDGLRAQRTSALIQLDLGGIAKGYAVDLALELLRRRGVVSASVNAGGDIGVIGGHGDRPWRIGIQHPRQAGELLARLDLHDQAVVTSGDYERFFERDGVRYHHIFDPHNGRPARKSQSVTVVAPQATLADALATAAFVLGPQAGLRLLEESSGVEGLIIAADGSRVITAGLKERLKWR